MFINDKILAQNIEMMWGRESVGIFLCSDYGGGLINQEKVEPNAECPGESERKRKIPTLSFGGYSIPKQIQHNRTRLSP